MIKFDLHTHTNASCDGDKSVEQLIRIAKNEGVSYISITDHNTTASLSEALNLSKDMNITVIPGIELDSIFEGRNFHVLGYGIQKDNERILELENDIDLQEKNAGIKKIEMMKNLGFKFQEDDVFAIAHKGFYITGETFAEVLLNNPETIDDPKLKPYLPGGSRCDNPYVNFYWDWCSVGKPAYVFIDYISTQNAIDIIHEAGGIAVLAHPEQNLGDRRELLDRLDAMGIDGIECYSTYHDIEDNEFYYQRTLDLNLLPTAGSDFHGKTKPSVTIGNYGLFDAERSNSILNKFINRINSFSS